MTTYIHFRHQAESPFDEIWTAGRGSTATVAHGHDPHAAGDGSGGRSTCATRLFT